MEINEQFKKEIAPFTWVEGDYGFCVMLEAGTYLTDVFSTRYEEGFEGNGYDWCSLAMVYLDEQCPDLADLLDFDPEADTFVVHCDDKDALAQFVQGFKQACENKELILDMFSRAELD